MGSRIEELTELLLDSYQYVGGINHIDGVNLPSKRAVEAITQHLLNLLFPGYYDGDSLKGRSVADVIEQQLHELHAMLKCELVKSLEFSPPEDLEVDDYEKASSDLACEFLGRLPELREILSTDVEAAFEGDPAAQSFEEIILAYPGLEAIAVQRAAHTLRSMGAVLIPRMMTEWAHGRTGIDIHPSAQIGRYFFADHGTGIVIGETCEIGERVKIYHGVTLGARSTSGGQRLKGVKRHPTIEDGVTIYPGVTILGGETVIGAGSTVGGNVVLNQSVPKNSLVYYEEQAVVVKEKPKKAAA